MYETSDQEWRRILIRGSLTGFIGSFLVVLAACLLVGMSLLNSVGCAIIPAIQGSWFYGGTLYLLRADYADEIRRKAKPVAASQTPLPTSTRLSAAG